MRERFTLGTEAELRTAVNRLADVIAGSRKIVFFGGAGVSTASGIPDFRSAGGLYSSGPWGGERPEYFLSHECLTEEPERFYAYYRENMLYPSARPNAAHRALAKLEEAGKLQAVITQNIDGLHQLAGSRRVIELHGSVLRNYCVNCLRTYDLDFVQAGPGVPVCPKCGGFVRPDVVMYGERLPEKALDDAIRAVCDVDTFIVAGTSLRVYPAASLLEYFSGKNLVLINRSATPYDAYATLLIRGSVEEVLARATEDAL